MKVAIIGSRRYENKKKIKDFIFKLKNEYGYNTIIVSGGCKKGADRSNASYYYSVTDYETTGEIADIPFLFDCSSSKLRVSREWNTQIMKLGGDRFASLWKLASVQTANRAGQKFMNISVSNVGWLKEDAYAFAKSFFQKTFGKANS